MILSKNIPPTYFIPNLNLARRLEVLKLLAQIYDTYEKDKILYVFPCAPVCNQIRQNLASQNQNFKIDFCYGQSDKNIENYQVIILEAPDLLGLNQLYSLLGQKRVQIILAPYAYGHLLTQKLIQKLEGLGINFPEDNRPISLLARCLQKQIITTRNLIFFRRLYYLLTLGVREPFKKHNVIWLWQGLVR